MKLKPTSVTVKNVKGFSLIELLVVLGLIMILSGATFFYFNAAQRLYSPDNQSLQIADIIQEARQRALTQRVTMRVQVDTTANVVRLINENTIATANDDVIIRQIPLLPVSEVRVDTRPDNITLNPPEPLAGNSATYQQSTYPLSPNNQVFTMRFLSNGSVVNAGNNDVGDGATIQGVTLHIWSPNTNNSNETSIARSLTVVGSTGSIRLWEYNFASNEANKWQDSRRTTGFSGDK